MNQTTITNRLKVLRAEKNITQAKLAELVSVTRTTINQIENNEYMPSLPLAMRIAKYFDQPIEAIFIMEKEND